MNYTNNTEYRQYIRIFFNMEKNNYSQNIQSNWDEETIDEMSYDEFAISKGLDDIYEKTKDNRFFQIIYQNAAAKMISTNYEIGLSICISYDYFKYFASCLELFEKNPNGFNEKSQEYQSIIKKIG